MIEIIPAIDLIGGKCVRLTQGDFAQTKIYNENPLEVARQFEAAGIKRLHLVDLDGAKAGEVINLSVLEKIATQTQLQIDFGGGIKTDESIQRVFDSGAAWATVGSVVVKDPLLFCSWIEKYGANRLFVGADVRNEKVAISGWTEETETTIAELVGFCSSKGIERIFCTDISKDGLLEGPSLQLYEKILGSFPGLSLVASGGVAQWSDVVQLESIGCAGVIIGKAIYEERITLKTIENYIRSC